MYENETINGLYNPQIQLPSQFVNYSSTILQNKIFRVLLCCIEVHFLDIICKYHILKYLRQVVYELEWSPNLGILGLEPTLKCNLVWRSKFK